MSSLKRTTDKFAAITPARQVVICGGIIAAYLAARFAIYRLIPAEDFDAWVRQDTAMDIPRVIAAAISLWMGVRWFGVQRLGLHWQRWRLPLALCGAHCIAATVFGTFREPFQVTSSQLLTLSLSSLAVAAFEDAMFLGALFQAAMAWKGCNAAIWGTTLVFTLYHWGAQPFWAFPQVVLVHASYAIARYLGCSLLALMIAHAAYDSAIFVLQGQGTPSFGADYWLWLGLLSAPLIAMSVLYSRSRQPVSV